MKLKTLLFEMFLLAGTTVVFASTNVNAKEVKKFDKARLVEISSFKKEKKEAVPTSCTVTASWTKNGIQYTASATTSCTCTQAAACNAAYAIVSLSIPQK
jgi:hypothetical protein